MPVIDDVQVAGPLLLGRHRILTAAVQIQDELLCRVPEGDIDELPSGVFDVLIATHEQCFDGLPLCSHGFLKNWELQALHWLHHRLHAFDDQVYTLRGITGLNQKAVLEARTTTQESQHQINAADQPHPLGLCQDSLAQLTCLCKTRWQLTD